MVQLEHDICQLLVMRLALSFPDSLSYAGLQMISYDLFRNSPQCFLHRCNLCQYIHTVALLFHQLLYPPHLTLDDLEPAYGLLLANFLNHTITIPPRGILSSGDGMVDAGFGYRLLVSTSHQKLARDYRFRVSGFRTRQDSQWNRGPGAAGRITEDHGERKVSAAATRGAMQSLYLSLEEKRVSLGVRISLETFSRYGKIDVYPSYAVGNLCEVTRRGERLGI